MIEYQVYPATNQYAVAAHHKASGHAVHCSRTEDLLAFLSLHSSISNLYNTIKLYLLYLMIESSMLPISEDSYKISLD